MIGIIYLIGIVIAIFPAYMAAKEITSLEQTFLGETFMFTLIFSLLSWGFIIGLIWYYFDQQWEYKKTCQPYFPKARQRERQYKEIQYIYDYGYSPNEAAIKAEEWMRKMYGDQWYLYGKRGVEDLMEADKYQMKIDEFLMDKKSELNKYIV